MDLDKKPSFDLSFVIPIVFGLFSLFGICLVILLSGITASRTAENALDTATPYRFLFLGTEPGFSTSEPDSDEAVTKTKTPIEFSSPIVPIDRVRTKPAVTPSPAAQITRTPSTSTPTSASASPLNPGTYDEGDSRIVYTGDWTAQSGVTGAYQTTLHVSNTLGNTINFRFIGQQVRLFYQSGRSLGSIRIVIDGLEIDLDQSAEESAASEWVSALLINGTHTVEITHQSGGSINLDYVIVPDVLITPSPTP
jgi:hypothetical protein